jgi:hypothetical protein
MNRLTSAMKWNTVLSFWVDAFSMNEQSGIITPIV